MAKLPLPPPVAELRAIHPIPYILPAGSEIWRIYKRGGMSPTRWNDFRHHGPILRARFDHHRRNAKGEPCVQARGIIYGAHGDKSIVTCVAEFFQEDRTVDRVRDEPWLVCFALKADVVLLDLCGYWPTRAGASMLINCHERRALTQSWSGAIYEAYPDIQGLRYGSSLGATEPAIALYERAQSALPLTPTFHRDLASAGLTETRAECCDILGYDPP